MSTLKKVCSAHRTVSPFASALGSKPHRKKAPRLQAFTGWILHNTPPIGHCGGASMVETQVSHCHRNSADRAQTLWSAPGDCVSGRRETWGTSVLSSCNNNDNSW